MSKTIGEDFSEDVKINRFRLEEENEIQPQLYDYYSRQYADARAAKDAEEDWYKLVLSKREMAIRENPPTAAKITESVISALVMQDSEVLDAKEKIRQVNATLYTLQAAMGAMDTRKSALDNLVSLYTKNYYNNKVSGGTDETSDYLNENLKRS